LEFLYDINRILDKKYIFDYCSHTLFHAVLGKVGVWYWSYTSI